MNILFITPEYYPHFGGSECIVKSVAERLARETVEFLEKVLHRPRTTGRS